MSGKEKDFAVIIRYLGLVTEKIDREKDWLYSTYSRTITLMKVI